MAPARTCLFGDHQDYLELPVITCAIDRHITLTAISNETDILRINKLDLNEIRDIPINHTTDTVEKGDHLLATLKVLRRYQCIPFEGYDVSIKGNIPINAGTSSSSAVIIAWIRFLLEAFGCNEPITPELVSRIAFEAEVLENEEPGGRMDQYSIGLGNIVYLETGSDTRFEVFNKKLKGLIVAESGIPKQSVAVLAELKGKAFAAIDKVKEKEPNFNIRNIRATDLPKYLDYLPTELQMYFKAAVLNHEITKQARSEFGKDDLDMEAIGKLMNNHHVI